MKRVLFIIMAVSLGLNAGLLYVRYLDRPGMQPPPGIEKQRQRMGQRPSPEVMIQHQMQAKTRHLKLSEQQQGQIRKILEEHLPTMAAFRNESGLYQDELAALYGAPQFDVQAFREAGRLAAQARSSADSLSALILSLEAEVLTPQQRISFAEVAPMNHSGPGGPPPRMGGPGRDGRPPKEGPPPEEGRQQ